MKMRRVTSMIAAVVMVFSLFAGIGIKTKASEAKVTSVLPKTTGLYMADGIPMKWDETLNKNVVITDKDQNGNTVLVNNDGSPVNYVDQDNPEYLTKGIEEGWGPWINPYDRFWFDYVDGNKVTHVPASKLKITHLDGSACEDAGIVASSADSRVVVFKALVTEPLLLTYTGAKKNNKMILMVDLMPGFYTTDTRTADGYVSPALESFYVGFEKTRDVYVHLSSNYDEELKYIVDPASALTVRYWDETQQKDVELTGQAAAEFASVSVVSDKDPHNMSYKVTLKGKKTGDNNRQFDLSFKYKEYRGDDKDSAVDRECFVGVQVFYANKFYMSSDDAIGIVDGKPVISDLNEFFSKDMRLETYDVPFYLAFARTGEDGAMTYIDDPNDLSFYMSTYDESTGEEGVGDKLPDEYRNLIQITRPEPYSHVLKVVVPTIPDMDRFTVVVGYKDQKPDPKECVSIMLAGGKNTSEGFHSSKASSSKTVIKEVSTDGTKPLTVYLATQKDDQIKQLTFKGVTLIDENGRVLSDRIKTKDAKISEKDTGFWDLGKAITIPAGTVSSGSILRAAVEFERNDGVVFTRTYSLLVFYTAPKKGTKFTSGGVTYTVTGKNAVSVSKVKASAKSVTIPASVGALKVTGIAAKAMNGCKKLTKITVKSADIKSIGAGAFTGVPAKATASVPKAKKAAYAKLFKKGGFKGKVK